MEDRFKKIEDDEAASGIIKRERKKGRFDHLEVGEEKVTSELKESKRKNFFPCPKCHRNNTIDNLYCMYCSYVFPEVAEKTNTDLQVYQIKCPQCGKICHREQKSCYTCGYHFVPTDEDILSQGERIEIEVDGIKYRSDDKSLPAFIKKALARIKRENLSPVGIQEIVTEIKTRKAEGLFQLQENIEKARYEALVSGANVLATGWWG